MSHEEDKDLMNLFDKPRKKLVDRHNPKHCSICGARSDNLVPHEIGKSTLYLCWFCEGILNEHRDIQNEEDI